MPVEVVDVELEGAASEQSLLEVRDLLAAALAAQQDPRQIRGAGTAGTALGGHRVVLSDAFVPATLQPVYRLPVTTDEITDHALAMTLSAADPDAPVVVLAEGLADESSWAWPAPCRLYLGLAGTLTPNPDALAQVVAPLGYAVSPTRILFRPTEPIRLV